VLPSWWPWQAVEPLPESDVTHASIADAIAPRLSLTIRACGPRVRARIGTVRWALIYLYWREMTRPDVIAELTAGAIEFCVHWARPWALPIAIELTPLAARLSSPVFRQRYADLLRLLKTAPRTSEADAGLEDAEPTPIGSSPDLPLDLN
jgi:hypothetical protein